VSSLSAAVKVNPVKNECVYRHVSVTDKDKADNLVTALPKKIDAYDASECWVTSARGKKLHAVPNCRNNT